MYALKTSKASKPRSLKGFTLLEVIIAVALFAIMTIGITTALKETTRLTKKVKNREVTTISAIVAMDRLERDLTMAFNENIQRSKTLFKAQEIPPGIELTFSYFDSEVKTLFLRRTPGIAVAFYHLEKAEDGSLSLLRSETPLAMLEKLKDSSDQVVASGVLDFKLKFLDGKTGAWVNTWDSAGPTQNNQFPEAVRVSLETVDTALPKEEWPNRSIKLETDFLVLNEPRATPAPLIPTASPGPNPRPSPTPAPVPPR